MLRLLVTIHSMSVKYRSSCIFHNKKVGFGAFMSTFCHFCHTSKYTATEHVNFGISHVTTFPTSQKTHRWTGWPQLSDLKRHFTKARLSLSTTDLWKTISARLRVPATAKNGTVLLFTLKNAVFQIWSLFSLIAPKLAHNYKCLFKTQIMSSKFLSIWFMYLWKCHPKENK